MSDHDATDRTREGSVSERAASESESETEAERETEADHPPTARDGVPDWDDEYVDRVGDRLFHSYDLEKDRRVGGERFDLTGELRVESSKHLFHPSVQYANHHMREHLFAVRESRVDVGRLEALVDLGHDLADERVEPSDEHRATEFTFVVIAPSIPDDVREFVANFSDRTLLRYGLHGHYEIHLCVVAPEREAIVSSGRTEIEAAFALWGSIDGVANENGNRTGLLGTLREFVTRGR